MITWTSTSQDTSGNGIYGQRYDAAGAIVGSEFQINAHTTTSQSNPSITALNNGGFVVTWHSWAQDTSGNGIYGQRYDAAGSPVGVEFLVNTYTTSDQFKSSVTGLENGGFVATWESIGNDTDGYGIFAQQYAAQLFGTALGEVISDTVGANWLHRQAGADVLKGLGGADTFKGGGGSDKLIGGGGADSLSGGGGIDHLLGGKGDDKLTGGGGDDKFIFKLGYGRDKIMDFQDDIDTFRLDDALWGGGMSKQQVIGIYASVKGGNIVFDFDTDKLVLKGFTDLTELKDDFGIF